MQKYNMMLASHSKSTRLGLQIAIRQDSMIKGVVTNRILTKGKVKGGSLTVNRSPHGNKTARDQFKLPIWKRKVSSDRLNIQSLAYYISHSKWKSVGRSIHILKH